jgi:hypothetical protein
MKIQAYYSFLHDAPNARASWLSSQCHGSLNIAARTMYKFVIIDIRWNVLPSASYPGRRRHGRCQANLGHGARTEKLEAQA